MRWTSEHDEMLRTQYAQLNNVEIGRLLGRSRECIKARAKKLGLKKPDGFLSTFQRGNVRACRTRFGGVKGYTKTYVIQPGTVAWISSHRHRNDYEWHIYTGTGHPKPLRLMLWRRNHGAVPPKHVVVYRDGNPRRCVLANLECISRQELCRRNANPTKQRATFAEGRCKPSLYAHYLFPRNAEMKAFVAEQAPELAETKRLQIILNYQLKQTQK